MAYRRRYRRRAPAVRKTARKAKAKSTISSIADVAYKGFKLASKVASLVNVETKYIDSTQAITAGPSYNGSMVGFNVPAQGDAYNQRNGDSIKLQSINSNFVFQWTAGGNPSYSTIRFMVLWDKENTLSAISDVLDSTLLGTTMAPYSRFNDHKRSEFNVLMDRTIQMQGTSHPEQLVRFNKSFAKSHKHMVFTPGTTTIEKGALKILMISNQPTTGSTNNSYSWRMKYVDN